MGQAVREVGVTMKTERLNQVWVVVEVESGVPTLAEVFTDKISAKKRECKLRMAMRQDYDEVGLFEATLCR